VITAMLRQRREQKKLKEARVFLRETDRMLKKAKLLEGQPKVDIATEQEALRKSIERGDLALVEKHAKRLDELTDKHLSAYRKGPFREYFESIGFAILVALTLRAFVLEAFKIPSGSMIPTLQIKDQIFVNKYIYGLRVPFTFLKFFEWNEPARGEVIVFIYPEDHHKDYIKRVVGLPGDTVQLKDGELVINNHAIPREPQGGNCEFWDSHDDGDRWDQRRCTAFTETLGTHVHTVIQTDPSGARRDFGPVKVLPRHVFVMGDNRDNSHDSRAWGQVPYENIKGRAMFIWFAQSQEGVTLSRLLQWIQ
jgi:signal peptidase I